MQTRKLIVAVTVASHTEISSGRPDIYGMGFDLSGRGDISKSVVSVYEG